MCCKVHYVPEGWATEYGKQGVASEVGRPPCLGKLEQIPSKISKIGKEKRVLSHPTNCRETTKITSSRGPY